MTETDFLLLVADMRAAQREHARTGSPAARAESAEIERIIDNHIARALRRLKKQD